jgi:hypothetical protein
MRVRTRTFKWLALLGVARGPGHPASVRLSCAIWRGFNGHTPVYPSGLAPIQGAAQRSSSFTKGRGLRPGLPAAPLRAPWQALKRGISGVAGGFPRPLLDIITTSFFPSWS